MKVKDLIKVLKRHGRNTDIYKANIVIEHKETCWQDCTERTKHKRITVNEYKKDIEFVDEG